MNLSVIPSRTKQIQPGTHRRRRVDCNALLVRGRHRASVIGVRRRGRQSVAPYCRRYRCCGGNGSGGQGWRCLVDPTSPGRWRRFGGFFPALASGGVLLGLCRGRCGSTWSVPRLYLGCANTGIRIQGCVLGCCFHILRLTYAFLFLGLLR